MSLAHDNLPDSGTLAILAELYTLNIWCAIENNKEETGHIGAKRLLVYTSSLGNPQNRLNKS
jgi:hypothetical protein